MNEDLKDNPLLQFLFEWGMEIIMSEDAPVVSVETVPDLKQAN